MNWKGWLLTIVVAPTLIVGAIFLYSDNIPVHPPGTTTEITAKGGARLTDPNGEKTYLDSLRKLDNLRKISPNGDFNMKQIDEIREISKRLQNFDHGYLWTVEAKRYLESSTRDWEMIDASVRTNFVKEEEFDTKKEVLSVLIVTLKTLCH